MIVMSKKKPPTGGKHTTPRKPVQFPAEWLAVARRMAATRPTPVVWYMIELIRKDAEAAGVTDLPPTPWAVGEDKA